MITLNAIDRDRPQKLYVQLYELLKGKIENVEWSVGSQIPTEDELCKLYEVSKATVKLAVLELARQGYLRRQQGKGTFVCKRVIPEGLTMFASFEEMMLEAGITFTTEVLAKTVMMPTEDLDVKLAVSDDQHLIYIKRLRSVDQEPVLLQEAYIPRHICPQLLEENITGASLFKLFEKKYGIPITKVKDYIEIAHVNEEEAGLLGLKTDSAALLLTQLFYSGETPIMFMRSLKRPDRFKFYIELDKKVA